MNPSCADQSDWIACTLCCRLVPPHLITSHHLVPREQGGQPRDRVLLCRQCHKQLHATFTNAELACLYRTVQQLRQAPRLQAFLRWVRKQKPDRNIRTTTSRDRRRTAPS